MGKSIIKIENLTKDYGSSKGIFDVSFKIKIFSVLNYYCKNTTI